MLDGLPWPPLHVSGQASVCIELVYALLLLTILLGLCDRLVFELMGDQHPCNDWLIGPMCSRFPAPPPLPALLPLFRPRPTPPHPTRCCRSYTPPYTHTPAAAGLPHTHPLSPAAAALPGEPIATLSQLLRRLLACSTRPEAYAALHPPPPGWQEPPPYAQLLAEGRRPRSGKGERALPAACCTLWRSVCIATVFEDGCACCMQTVGQP